MNVLHLVVPYREVAGRIELLCSKRLAIRGCTELGYCWFTSGGVDAFDVIKSKVQTILNLCKDRTKSVLTDIDGVEALIVFANGEGIGRVPEHEWRDYPDLVTSREEFASEFEEHIIVNFDDLFEAANEWTGYQK